MSTRFLSNENLNLIWGVISENGENIGSDLDKYKFFQENVGMFYKENKSITNLLVLNKKYIGGLLSRDIIKIEKKFNGGNTDKR